MDEPTSRDRARRARAREVATHRRAVELHEKAVLNLTESRHFDRAEAAQMRLAKARRRLQEALEHEQLLQGPGYAAMAPRASDKVVHAVPDGQRTSLCGLETAFMVGVAKDFGAMPPARQCPECVRAVETGG